MTDRQKLLEALILIRDKGRRVSNGICGNVELLLTPTDFEVADEIMDDLILRWMKPGDNPVYPVGGVAEYHRERARHIIWDNPRRWELLHFMIAKLEAA